MKSDIDYACISTPIGHCLVGQNNKGICSILFGDSSAQTILALRQQFSQSNLIENTKRLINILEDLVAFIEKPDANFSHELDIVGTPFQKLVWDKISKIPFGKTLSYTDLAQKIGSPLATRAVANACAANRIAIIIPCHRVIKSDGQVSGYRWGKVRKKMLLALEAGHY